MTVEGTPTKAPPEHQVRSEEPPTVDRRRDLIGLVARVGVILLFVAMVVLFSLLRPDNFPNWDNARAILQQASVLAVLGVGLTVVLVMGEFDLSFEANTSLAGAFAVYAMTTMHLSTGLGILAGIVVGTLLGVANGTLIAYAGTPAFITTLATASVAMGIQSWFTDDQTLFGVPQSYISLSTDKILGIPLFIWI